MFDFFWRFLEVFWRFFERFLELFFELLFWTVLWIFILNILYKLYFFKVTTNPSRSVLKPQVKSPNRSLFIGLEEDTESSFNSSQLRPKQSVKKLTVKVNATRRTSESILFNKTRGDSTCDSLPTTPRTNGRIPFSQDTADTFNGTPGMDHTPNGSETGEMHGGLQNPVEPLVLDSVRV